MRVGDNVAIDVETSVIRQRTDSDLLEKLSPLAGVAVPSNSRNKKSFASDECSGGACKHRIVLRQSRLAAFGRTIGPSYSNNSRSVRCRRRPAVPSLYSLLLVAAGAVFAAAPAQSLGIRLQDSSADPSIAHMRIVLDQGTIKPGRVTLRAENQSEELGARGHHRAR